MTSDEAAQVGDLIANTANQVDCAQPHTYQTLFIYPVSDLPYPTGEALVPGTAANKKYTSALAKFDARCESDVWAWLQARIPARLESSNAFGKTPDGQTVIDCQVFAIPESGSGDEPLPSQSLQGLLANPKTALTYAYCTDPSFGALGPCTGKGTKVAVAKGLLPRDWADRLPAPNAIKKFANDLCKESTSRIGFQGSFVTLYPVTKAQWDDSNGQYTCWIPLSAWKKLQ